MADKPDFTNHTGDDYEIYKEDNKVIDKSKELLESWKQLNDKANSLLRKHSSFRQYNKVRCQMDSIERLLRDGYGIDVYNIKS
jgi:hypothetical protein